MNAAQILRKARRDHDATLAEIAEWLGTSNQRVSQWESGDAIPAERVTAWIKDEAVPGWVRQMAREIEVAMLKHEHEVLGERIESLAQAITPTV